MKTAIALFTLAASVFAESSLPPVKVPDPVAQNLDLTRTVPYNERDIPAIHVRTKYTTVFVVPKGERIMDILCGDKDNWTVDGADGTNLAYVKPNKAAIRTNLNLIAASGNVYSFLLVEDESFQPDLKVFVTTNDDGMLKAMSGKPKWVTSGELDMARKETEQAKKEVDQAHKETESVRTDADKAKSEMESQADSEMAKFKNEYPLELKHDYVITGLDKDLVFNVHAIAHNADFTFLWAAPSEAPALYEVKDGKPSLINFTYNKGLYTVPRVLDHGYLVVGKKKLEFRRNLEPREVQ